MAKDMNAEVGRSTTIENALQTPATRRGVIRGAIGAAIAGAVGSRETAKAQDVAANYFKAYTDEQAGLNVHYPATGYEAEAIENGIILSRPEDEALIFITREELKEGDTAESLLDESLEEYKGNTQVDVYGNPLEREVTIRGLEDPIKLPGWNMRVTPKDGASVTDYTEENGIVYPEANSVYRFVFTCPDRNQGMTQAGFEFEMVVMRKVELLPANPATTA